MTATITLIDIYFIASYLGVAAVIITSIFAVTSPLADDSFVLDMTALDIMGVLYAASTANLFSGYCRRPQCSTLSTPADAKRQVQQIPLKARV